MILWYLMPRWLRMPVWCRCGLQVLEIEVEADIAIEFAIFIIARISFDGAPDLLRRFAVPSQGGHAAFGAGDWRIHAELGPRLGIQNAMGIHEEVAYAGIAAGLHPRRAHSRIRAARFLAAVCRNGVRTRGSRFRPGPARRSGCTCMSGQEAMRGAAGDDFQLARSKKRRKPWSRLLPY